MKNLNYLNDYGLEALRLYLAYLVSIGKSKSYSELAAMFYLPKVGPANRKHPLYLALEVIQVDDAEAGIPPRSIAACAKSGDKLPSNGYFRLRGTSKQADRKAIYENDLILAKRYYGQFTAKIEETPDSFYYPAVHYISANDSVVSQRIVVNGVEVSGDHQQMGRKH